MPHILVSVIIPVYNCAGYIKEALDSVLNQTMDSFEIIVVDDFSTDGTRGIVTEYAAGKKCQFQLLCNPRNMGVAYSRNQALKQARGKYICFLDGDDVWFHEKLQKQIEFIEKRQCDFIYTGYGFISDDGRPCGNAYRVPEQLVWKRLLYENVVGCSTVMCRAELFQKYRFRENYFHEDYALWLELLENGYCACGIPEPLVRYRLTRQSKSGNKLKAAKGRWEIYRKFLQFNRLQALQVFMVYAILGIKKRCINHPRDKVLLT